MQEIIDQYLEGEVILIDKPLGWTSFDVVNYIRNFFRLAVGLKKIKIGHAGTLDPLASGLLILCTGRATKRIDTYQGLEKVYECTMDFSGSTPSFDKESEPDRLTPFGHLNEEVITNALQNFKGEIEQVPPSFSAIKVGGVRAYEHARKDVELILHPRKVEISEFELLGLKAPYADFRITCSKGTYVRSLARDLGKEVNCGAYLTMLRRTAIGDFSVDSAETPEEFCSRIRASLGQ